MSHDLPLTQSHAFHLARTLMVPVALFEVDGAFDVLPSDELGDAEVAIIHEFDPQPDTGRLIEPAFPLGSAACEWAAAREPAPRLASSPTAKFISCRGALAPSRRQGDVCEAPNAISLICQPVRPGVR